jgi:hypothetical protein
MITIELIFVFFECIYNTFSTTILITGRRGRDCMVVGFTTTCVISAYHH